MAFQHASRHFCKATYYRGLSTKVETIEAAFSIPNAAVFLAAASTPESIPKLSGSPELVWGALFIISTAISYSLSPGGRANVGKSTLLNAVLGRAKLVHTSKKAGRTRALNFFRVGRDPGNLVLVDAPGYGMRGRAEWGAIWDHYIGTRKQLRQICILINARHGVTVYDHAMLTNLVARLAELSEANDRPRAPVLQPVLTKLDLVEGTSDERMKKVRQIMDDLAEVAPLAAPPVLCAMSPNHSIGVEAMRRAMAEACSE
ncbi:hypothetical protein M0805_001072 [Coniferiporia weirii]|nr:hypothetical protein M0805_001072 [Coniferiporia weirii]